MTKDEALKLANWLQFLTITDVEEMTIQAMEETTPDEVNAMAQPAQEPEVWGMRSKDGQIYDVICPKEHAALEGSYKVPLYTTPQQRPWVGLTDDELVQIGVATGLERAAAQMIESKLKEKNT